MSIYERQLQMSERMRLAEDIKQDRKANGLGQIALAKLAGVSRNTVQRLEYSEHVNTDLRQRVKRALVAYNDMARELRGNQ